MASWPVLSAGQLYEDRFYSQPALTIPLRPNRVLTNLTWIAQAQTSDRVRHATNLAGHLLNGVLIAALASGVGLSAWWVAGLFLLWPIQSEAVGYLASRADLLMTTALLLMALACVSRHWGRACLLAFVAMTCKESGVAAVGVLLLWPGCPKTVRVTVVLAALLACPFAWTLMDTEWSWQWVLQQTAGLSEQALGLIRPFTLRLAPDPVPATGLGVVVMGATCLGLLWASWRSPIRRLAVGWVASVLVLRFVIPTPLSVVNSHQVYAAMVGVCLWIGSFHGNHAIQQSVRDHQE